MAGNVSSGDPLKFMQLNARVRCGGDAAEQIIQPLRNWLGWHLQD
jgi:hypothetical protein